MLLHFITRKGLHHLGNRESLLASIIAFVTLISRGPYAFRAPHPRPQSLCVQSRQTRGFPQILFLSPLPSGASEE